MPAPTRSRLSQRALTDLLSYNRHTGVFTWRKYRSRTAKPGDIAGTPNIDGSIIITIAGRPYSANRLAWLYVTGTWPEGRLTYVDGNPENTRWGNIISESERYSPSASAEYQRNRRAHIRAARIEHDTYNPHAQEDAAYMALYKDK